MKDRRVLFVDDDHTLREVLPFLKDALGQFAGAGFALETK